MYTVPDPDLEMGGGGGGVIQPLRQGGLLPSIPTVYMQLVGSELNG